LTAVFRFPSANKIHAPGHRTASQAPATRTDRFGARRSDRGSCRVAARLSRENATEAAPVPGAERGAGRDAGAGAGRPRAAASGGGFSPWDNLPYDRVPASRAVMGHRAGVLRWLTDDESPPDLVLTAATAVIQRVPPQDVWAKAHLKFRVGDGLDAEVVRRELRATWRATELGLRRREAPCGCRLAPRSLGRGPVVPMGASPNVLIAAERRRNMSLPSSSPRPHDGQPICIVRFSRHPN
jgi:hypothetical protein